MSPCFIEDRIQSDISNWKHMLLIQLKPSLLLSPLYLTLQTLDHFVFWVCLRPESSCEHERQDLCQKRAA